MLQSRLYYKIVELFLRVLCIGLRLKNIIHIPLFRCVVQFFMSSCDETPSLNVYYAVLFKELTGTGVLPENLPPQMSSHPTSETLLWRHLFFLSSYFFYTWCYRYNVCSILNNFSVSPFTSVSADNTLE